MERRNLGWLWSKYSFLRNPKTDQTIRIDNFFISKERLREEPEYMLQIAPDLVVQTKHPGAPRWEYRLFPTTVIDLGVGTVWHIDPVSRSVDVHEMGQEIQALSDDLQLVGTGALKGFSIGVNEFINTEWDGTKKSVPWIKIRPRFGFMDHLKSIFK